jgi:hypothetical protein
LHEKGEEIEGLLLRKIKLELISIMIHKKNLGKPFQLLKTKKIDGKENIIRVKFKLKNFPS